LDFVAKRYGKLPSEVMSTGYTIDLYCGELAVGYERYLANKDNPQAKQPGQDEMQAMIDNVRKNK
jgi:hypothetical protein